MACVVTYLMWTEFLFPQQLGALEPHVSHVGGGMENLVPAASQGVQEPSGILPACTYVEGRATRKDPAFCGFSSPHGYNSQDWARQEPGAPPTSPW